VRSALRTESEKDARSCGSRRSVSSSVSSDPSERAWNMGWASSHSRECCGRGEGAAGAG
jgi:hypothetical protein